MGKLEFFMPIQTLADVEVIEAQPLSSYNLPPSTYEQIRCGTAIRPDAPALHFFLLGDEYTRPVSYTHRQLFEKITQTANMLHHFGIGKEDVVSYLLPNLPQTFFTLWGGEAAGIASPINPLLEARTIAEIMNAARTKVLVTLAPFPNTDVWQKVESIRAQVPTLKTVLQVDLAQFLPLPKKMIVNLMRLRAAKSRSVPGQTILNFDQELVKHPTDRLVSGRVIQPEDIASYFHTGGTTGIPKIALHTHANEVFNAWTAGQNVGQENAVGKVLFCALPLFHVNAVIVTGLIPMGYGGTVVIGTPQGFRGKGVIQNFWKIVEHYRINFFAGVPTAYSALLDVPLNGADVSSLEFALCGAAPMPTEVFRKFESMSGLRILEGYGLTEGTCVNSANPAGGERRIGSIGYRVPFVQMKTVKLDADGSYAGDCAPDEVGNVVLRGPSVFKGYLEAVHNKDVWIDDGDGQGHWLNTGDLGRMDADGYFWLTGRSKELIIRGGHNIDPAIIEGTLHKHPAVALAAALGRPDAHAGEVPVAYVQLKPNQSATPDDLLNFTREHIGERAALPKVIRIVEQMPLTAVGKIHKPPLKYREIGEVYRETLAGQPGIKDVQIEVQPDRARGTVAYVKIIADGQPRDTLEAALRPLLGQFTVPFELSISE